MRKIIAIAAGVFLLIGTVAYAIGTAGSKDDPLITVSYIENKFLPSLKKQMEDKIDISFQTANSNAQAKISSINNSHNIPSSDDEIATALAAKLPLNGGGFKNVTFKAGSKIKGNFGMRILIDKGSAKITSGSLINLTDGKEIKYGTALKLNNSYLAPESSDVTIEVTNSDCNAKISGNYSEIKAAKPRDVKYTAYGDALKTLGLFQGTEKGYELERPATRIEGLVMLIRLLGEEKAAKEYTGGHPFNDVLSWSECYVSYAYHKGYTKGSSATTFGGSSQLSASEYLTFLLRALEYNDSDGDFVWNQSLEKSVEFGLLTSSEKDEIKSSDCFYRDHIVLTSYKSLSAKIKGGSLQLVQKLLGNGSITQQSLNEAQKIIPL